MLLFFKHYYVEMYGFWYNKNKILNNFIIFDCTNYENCFQIILKMER